VREAKALVPSAWHWASGTAEPIRFLDLARGIHRSPDPWLRVSNGYVLRRIAVQGSRWQDPVRGVEGRAAELPRPVHRRLPEFVHDHWAAEPFGALKHASIHRAACRVDH
jgi:hypothetical protein